MSRATLPSGDWEPAGAGVPDGAPVVVLHLEDDPAYVFDLTLYAGSIALRRQLCDAVLARTTQMPGVRRTTTVATVRRACSSFLRWLWCQQQAGAISEVQSVADLTPFHLVQFRLFLESTMSAKYDGTYSSEIAKLLRLLPVNDAVLSYARRRPRTPWIEPERVEGYARDEFDALARAARNVLRVAQRRITLAYAEARLGTNPDATPRQRALHGLLSTGVISSDQLTALRPEEGRATLRGARKELFMTGEEVAAAALLVASKSGLNLSVIHTMKIPTMHSDSIAQVDVDKPRRGPSARFWSEIGDAGADNRGLYTMLQMILEATEPAREVLRLRGTPTDRLFVRWEVGRMPLTGAVTTGSLRWNPLSSRPQFRRMRRSLPTGGVGREPTHHSRDAHLHYVRTNTSALEDQQFAAARGVQAALDRARQQLNIPQVRDEEADQDNDAMVANCVDPRHHPQNGQACTSSYFSFLDCLECDNAISANRLLPRQIAALDVLEEIRDVAGDLWSISMQNRVHILRALVERCTPAEIQWATPLSLEYRPLIMTALKSEVPRHAAV
ncbi:hypothetical protein SRABI98_00045 [Microbacterium sp. Bi98]|uniref:hypothetical protein n=1 Tax=Microbacterium sp. Bi98 TaxID=2821116 RepID=UPI001D99759B|nr:hypothetical protein [Microbacterium sp. Bi98]CAH0123877.1 hypothetical protein SRABI98_00045 [Microbacterium sp. Bi98]